MEAFYV